MNEIVSPHLKRAIGEVQAFELADDNQPRSGAVNALRTDGVVCIRSAFSRRWLDVIETGLAQALNGASTDLDIAKREGDIGAFSFSSQAWTQVDAFRDFIFNSPMSDIAWALLETRRLVLFYDFLLVKEARSDHAATPWHQDHSYYPVDGTKAVNCWVALDDIPERTALRFMKASHREGKLYRAVNFQEPDQDYRHARKELAPPPSEDDVDFDVITTPMSPGDMLVWKSFTLHSAPGNVLDQRRAAFSVNWLGDDIVYNAKPSLETYRAPGVKVGEPMDSEKFPLVRSI